MDTSARYRLGLTVCAIRETVGGLVLAVLVSGLAVACPGCASPQLGAGRLPHVPVEHLAVVDEGVYRSGDPGPGGYEELARLGVATVIDLRHGATVPAEALAAGIDVVLLPLRADIESEPPTAAQVERFFETVLDPARQPVLFHCRTGRDRTGTMAALYRMEVQRWTNDEAVAEMQALGYHDYYRDLIDFVRRYRPRFLGADATANDGGDDD